MVLALYPQPSLFDDDVALVRNATPVKVSAFYVRRPMYVPWSAEETTFVLETDEPSATHEIIVNRSGRTKFVPGEKKYSIQLQLKQGANRIEISTPSQSTYITVAATGVESWFTSLGREYYLSTGQRLNDIRDQFNTPWTTRISAHFIPYADLFLPARMPKIQQTRLATMTSMGQRLGHGDGVRQIATAVSYSTPFVTDPLDTEFVTPGLYEDYPMVTTYPTTGAVKGRVLDLWSPNNCLAAHQALFQLVLAMGGEDVIGTKVLDLVSKDDRQIILKYLGGPPEVHYLDPMSSECSDIEFNTSCDASVRVWAQVYSDIDIVMATPQMSFDETVESAINFGFFDEGAYFDASTGHTDPGLGGGDDHFDTVDVDDPYGDGFKGFSLSRRFDAPACLDTRIQVGQRLSKFTAPLKTTTDLTPEPPLVEGDLLTVDAETGAPPATIGTDSFWATSNRLYMYEGDQVRFEALDLETSIVSAWPVLDDTSQIDRTELTATYTPSGTEKIITAPTKFFTLMHQGYGLQIASEVYDGSTAAVSVTNGAVAVVGASTAFTADLAPGDSIRIGDDPSFYTIDTITDNTHLDLLTAFAGTSETSGALWTSPELYCISATSDNGTNSTATLTGNPAVPSGTMIVNVYDPLRDRQDTTAVSAALQNATGHPTYEITLTAVLISNLATGDGVSYRVAPRISGAIGGASPTVSIMSDVAPLPGDLLYFDSTTAVPILSAIANGTHHTTGFPLYDIELDGVTPSAYSDNDPLFVVRADACWKNGDPVTPLMLISLAPAAYLTV